MKSNIKIRWFLSIMFCLRCFISVSQGNFSAVNDTLKTGPMQRARVDVVFNDTLVCHDYTLRVLSVLDPVTQGVAVFEGDYLQFTPGLSCINTTVPILYGLTCDGVEDTATVMVQVTSHNLPVNMIDEGTACADLMPSNVSFGMPSLKFITKGNGLNDPAHTSSNFGGTVSANNHSMFTWWTPLVGDLNGDGKPEIVALGVDNSGTTMNDAYGRFVDIFNGQTGVTIFQLDLNTLGSNYGNQNSQFHLQAGEWHTSACGMALVDLDNDGIVEIILCQTGSLGLMYALKPIYNENGEMTSLKKIWDAEVSYKAPLSNDERRYGAPTPIIADINRDGKPEIIVYNKIYNNEGKLLMCWGTAGTNAASLSTSSTSGLQEDWGRTDWYTNKTYSDQVRSHAMTGHRPPNGRAADGYINVPAVYDIDNDGILEIVTGNRIYKFNITNPSGTSGNTYSTVEGPVSIKVPVNTQGTSTRTLYFNDAFTRVADFDGDGKPDILNVFNVSCVYDDLTIGMMLWDPTNPSEVKGFGLFFSNGQYGSFAVPFVGDINGKVDGWDGTAYTRKLPEFGFCTGDIYINRTTDNSGRSGIKFHPLAGNELKTDNGDNIDNNNTTHANRNFNYKSFHGRDGHVVAFTYDASEPQVYDRLKLSWALEHADNSDNTGLTMFDFNNDGAQDLVYRDMKTLRVISPKKGNKDYVLLTDNTTAANPSILFSTYDMTYASKYLQSSTGYETPVVADINMDGSADIVTTGSYGDLCMGYVVAFEHGEGSAAWAPCPPVWNQGLYDPRLINEKLQVPARPISALTPYTDAFGETVYPYNSNWAQVPIVKENEIWAPVTREPDVIATDMTVSISGNTATIQLTISNQGSATVSESTPVTFYNGGTDGKDLAHSTKISGSYIVGKDIFPGEKETLTYTLSGNYNNMLLWARVTDDGTSFPATGFTECVLEDNVISGIDCPYLQIKTTAYPSESICGQNGMLKLSITHVSGGVFAWQHSPTFQWYKNEKIMQGVTDSVVFVRDAGNYRCFVTDGICRKKTQDLSVTKDYQHTIAPLVFTCDPADGVICGETGHVEMNVKNSNNYVGYNYSWYRNHVKIDGANTAKYNALEAGFYRVVVTDGACLVSDTMTLSKVEHATDCIQPDTNGIVYVNKRKNGHGNSWDNACRELAVALKAAEVNPSITKIYVAGATYFPMYSSDETGNTQVRNFTFAITRDIDIYGGFPNTATNATTFSDRCLEGGRDSIACDSTYKTILNGEVSTGNKVYHTVIFAKNCHAQLNGFTIINGNADGEQSHNYQIGTDFGSNATGGGILCLPSSPILENLIIRENSSTGDGGGLYANAGVDVTGKFLTFDSNTASARGGAICLNAATGTMSNTIVRENEGQDVSAVYTQNNGARLLLRDVVVYKNVSRQSDNPDAGTIVANAQTQITMVNATVADNNAQGVKSLNDGVLDVQNSIIAYNYRPDLADPYSQSGTYVTYQNTLIKGVDLTGAGQTNFKWDYNCENSLFRSRSFVGTIPVAPCDYRLVPCSKMIDAGNNALYTNAGGDMQNDKDLFGQSRLLLANIDVGAYESANKNTLPTATTLTTSSHICQNQSVELFAFTGTAPWSLTYTENDTTQVLSGIQNSTWTFVPDTTGTYHFEIEQITDANCSAGIDSQQCTITVHPMPSLQIESEGKNANFIFTGGMLPYTVDVNPANLIPQYEILPPAGLYMDESKEVLVPDSNRAGAYRVIASLPAENNCEGTSDTLYVTVYETPKIQLPETCTLKPRLELNYQYEGTTYEWQYHAGADTANSSWNVVPRSNTPVLYVNQGGSYRVKITWNHKTFYTQPVLLTIKKQKNINDITLYYYELVLE
jgi:predicted outer membrane repeat protein